MPRKPATSMKRSIREERWFLMQCLARNEEYLALYERDLETKAKFPPSRFPFQPPRRTRKTMSLARELGRIAHFAAQRFRLFMVLDPRPFKNRPLEQVGNFDEVLFESIRLRTKVPVEHTARYSGLHICDASLRERHQGERFLSFTDGGVDLCMIIDVRHTKRRLRYDFERILGKIDQLKRSGQLGAFPERPRPAVWRKCLRVWDLRKAGVRNRDVAKQVFKTECTTNPENAKVLATQHYKNACRWISLDWCRSGVKAKGSP